MSHVVYSAQKRDFLPGLVYRNPRFFHSAAPAGVTQVTVVGDWPRVVEAYERLKIKVSQVRSDRDIPTADSPRVQDQPDPDPDDDGDGDPGVTIPNKLDSLSWKKVKELIGKIDPEARVTNRQDGIAWLEKYRADQE